MNNQPMNENLKGNDDGKEKLVQYPQIDSTLTGGTELPHIQNNGNQPLQYPDVYNGGAENTNDEGSVEVKQVTDPKKVLTKRDSKTPLITQHDVIVHEGSRRRDCCKKCCCHCCLWTLITIGILSVLTCCLLIVGSAISGVVTGIVYGVCVGYKNMESNTETIALAPYGTDLKILNINNYGSLEIFGIPVASQNERIEISYRHLDNGKSKKNFDFNFVNSTGTFSIYNDGAYIRTAFGIICSDLDIKIYIHKDRADLSLIIDSNLHEFTKVFNMENIKVKSISIDDVSYGSSVEFTNVTAVENIYLKAKYSIFHLLNIKMNDINMDINYCDYSLKDITADGNLNVNDGYSIARYDTLSVTGDVLFDVKYGVLYINNFLNSNNFEIQSKYMSLFDVKKLALNGELIIDSKYSIVSIFECLKIISDVKIIFDYGTFDMNECGIKNTLDSTSSYSVIRYNSVNASDVNLNNEYDGEVSFENCDIFDRFGVVGGYSTYFFKNGVLNNVRIMLEYSYFEINKVVKHELYNNSGINFDMKYSTLVLNDCDLGDVKSVYEFDYSNLEMLFYSNNLHNMKVNIDMNLMDYGWCTITDVLNVVQLSVNEYSRKIGYFDGGIDTDYSIDVTGKYSGVAMQVLN